jgi:hypothetical protein
VRQLIWLIVASLWASAFCAAAEEEDAELRRYLSLLTGARLGDDYNAIKKLAPEIEALQPDVGDDNTEAWIKTKVGPVSIKGEFNFAKGRLVSHGFATGELTHTEAHEFLLRCITILEKLYGPSKRAIELPSESDGPNDSIGLYFRWHKGKIGFALECHYRREFASVNWGAQKE